jgi:galactokinase
MKTALNTSRPLASDGERAAQVAARFESRFGRAPEGVWAAPGRVNLIGEHTDYNDGFVLPFALAHSAYVAVARRSDGLLHLISEQLEHNSEATLPLAAVAPGAVEGWASYVAGAVWALQQSHGVEAGGLDLLLDSDVPPGAGVSSSAALSCSTTLACAELFGAPIDRQRLALSAHRAEVEIAGVPCGKMDQTISMCGQAAHALFLDCRSLAIQQIPLPLSKAGLTTLVINTQAPHRLVSGEYAARRKSCEAAARALNVAALRDATLDQVMTHPTLDEVARKRARHVVSENERVLRAIQCLEAGTLEALGTLLNASHASLRDDFEVSVPELDVAAAVASSAGALGARMIGGGFGGCVLALVPSSAVDTVFAAVVNAYRQHGFTPPTCFAALPAPGARRVA